MARRLSALVSVVLGGAVLTAPACVKVDRDAGDDPRDSASDASRRSPGTGPTLNQPFDGQRLNIDVRSGEVAIRAAEAGKVVVHCSGRDRHRCDEVTAALRGNDLRIAGGPRRVALRIEVPPEVGLNVRMPAGELTIDGVRGDKDVRLNAGELRITSPDPTEYGSVSARLLAGEIRAEPYGGTREGILRRLNYQGDGPYHLSARLMAGEMLLH